MVETSREVGEITGEGQAIPVRHRARFAPDESLMSHELRKKLWDGLIPLKIDLALGDIISLEKPRSLYVRLNFLLTRYLVNGTERKLPVFHPKRCQISFWFVRPSRSSRQVQHHVVRVQWQWPQVELAYRCLVWYRSRHQKKERRDSLVSNLSLQRQS